MPSDRPCICGGAGWDGCEVVADVVPAGLDRLRDSLSADADRPLGFRGLLITDRTALLLAEVVSAEGLPVRAPSVPVAALERSYQLPIDLMEVSYDRTLA